MWKAIPDYPNYKLNIKTLEVKSVDRFIKHWRGGKSAHKGRILKPNIAKDGYYYFTLLNQKGQRNFKRSQICWLVRTGSLPPKHLRIDHIDADITNDHFDNLQLLTHRENIGKGFQDKGRDLPTGVYKRKDIKKFQARIWEGGKLKHLGYFDKVEDAAKAYRKAESKLKHNKQ